MAVYLDITADGEQTEDFFRHAGYRSRDMREPLRTTLHDVLLAGIAEQFVTEGGRSGGWEPLSESYLARKPPGLPILVLTDAMEEYLLLGDEPGGPARITMETLTFDPKMDRVSYHQWGGWNGRGYLPARPTIEWTAGDDEKTALIFEEWLTEVMEHNTRRFGGAVPDTLPQIAGIF